MKEVIFNKAGNLDALNVVEGEIPEPNANEVVVKAVAIGVNPVENLIAFGLFPGGEVTPHRLGTDAAGIIHQVGSNVTDFKTGDRVWVYFPHYQACGTYAEYFKCPSKVNARASETILVHGASGAVGRASVQFGLMMGLTVIGTAGNDENLKLVKDLGAHHVLNYKDKEFKKRVMEITKGKGANIIVEPLADVNLPSDVECVADLGRIVVFGGKSDMASFHFFTLMAKRATIHGQVVFYATEAEVQESAAYINAGLASGCLTPTVGHEFPLSDVREALGFLKSGKAKGKIILIP